MQIYKRNNSKNWWATWTGADGQRHRKTTGTPNKKQAEALAASWVTSGFMVKNFGQTPDVPFKNAFIRYAKQQKQNNTKSFFSSTRYRLRTLFKCFHNFNIADISLADIENFMSTRRSVDGVKLQTVQKDVSTLRAILNKAHREGDLDKVPLFPKLVKSKPKTRWLTHEEETLLIKNAPPHLALLIQFATNTGGRRGELLNLDWKNVDLQRKQIIFVQTKNGEDRVISLSNKAIDVLKQLEPKASGFVFTYNGHQIKCVKTSFNTARNKAQLEDVRFHDLRHTFASRLVQGSIPLYEVMKMTGHKSLEMVQRYSHLGPDYQKKSIDVLNLVGHKMDTAPQSKSDDNSISC